MTFICKLKKAVDPDILRSLGLPEDLQADADAIIDDEFLWRHGVYDEESFKEKLGEIFDLVGGD